LGSIVCKVIDKITLENHKHVLRSSDFQYRFKAKHSTSHCTFVLHEVIDYYTNNDSYYYVFIWLNYCTNLKFQVLDVILAMCFLEVLGILTMYVCCLQIEVQCVLCLNFSKEYDAVFNTSKTHFIIYNERRKYQKMVPLCLNGETLNIQRVAIHLGHPVAIDNVNSITIRNAKRDLIWRINYVMV